jgi:MFS transporter, DHA2 family, multidrug resistance protein
MENAGARRWWILAAIVLATLAIGLDGTVLSVALPTLAGTLHATTTQLQWFLAAYTLVLAAAVLPGGLLGDRFGRKRMLMIALVVFGLGSLACAYAGSPGAFIAARVVAGIGAAFATPMSLSVLAVVFDDRQRPRAVGIWAGATFLALPIGPIIGGWLLSNYWWGWVFLVNLPVVVLGVVAVALWVPQSRGARRPGLDPVGVLTSCAGLATLTYGTIRAGQHGWGDPAALAEIAGGLVLLAAFGLTERALGARPGGRPIVDVGLFGSASFTWGTVLAALGGFALIGLLFTAPQYFQAVRGADAMGSGLRLLPLIGGIVAGAVSADRLAGRLGAKVVTAAGFLLMAAGFLVGAATGTGSGFAFVAAWTALIGAGLGISLATTSSAALAQLSSDRAGVGSAVMQTVQKVGAPLGAAVLGSVLNAGYRDRLPVDGLPPSAAGAARDSVFAAVRVADQLGSARLREAARGAFVHGMDVMLVTCGGVAAAAVVLALLFLPGRTSSPDAARTAGEPTVPRSRPQPEAQGV